MPFKHFYEISTDIMWKHKQISNIHWDERWIFLIKIQMVTIGNKYLSLMRSFSHLFLEHSQSPTENPSTSLALLVLSTSLPFTKLWLWIKYYKAKSPKLFSFLAFSIRKLRCRFCLLAREFFSLLWALILLERKNEGNLPRERNLWWFFNTTFIPSPNNDVVKEKKGNPTPYFLDFFFEKNSFSSHRFNNKYPISHPNSRIVVSSFAKLLGCLRVRACVCVYVC